MPSRHALMTIRRRRFDPQVIAWRDEVIASGGSALGAIAALNAYVRSCKAAGALWTKLSAGMILPLCPDSYSGVVRPLIAPMGIIPTITSFLAQGGSYSLVGGLDPGTGNNQNFVDTQYVPSDYFVAAPSAPCYAAVYCMSSGQGVDNWPELAILFGAVGLNGIDRLLLQLRSSGSNDTIADAYGIATASRARTSSLSTSVGFFEINRTGGEMSLSQDGAIVATATSADGLPPNRSIHLFRTNSPDWNSYDSRAIGFFCVTPQSLTPAEQAAHNAAIDTFLRAIGRKV